MVCVLSSVLSCLVCQTRRFSFLIRALSYSSINESLTFFHILIKRTNIKKQKKKDKREMSIVTIAILLKELLLKVTH